jgi:hypothetical protein
MKMPEFGCRIGLTSCWEKTEELMMRLESKVAIITGADSGMGKAMAELFVR